MQDREAGALQPVQNVKPYKRVQGIHQIERFFRVAAGLEIDKEDIRRYYEFVDQKVEDLLLNREANGKGQRSHRGRVARHSDYQGLQESIRAFESLDVDVGLKRILAESVPEPQIDGPYSEEVEGRLPAIAAA